MSKRPPTDTYYIQQYYIHLCGCRCGCQEKAPYTVGKFIILVFVELGTKQNKHWEVAEMSHYFCIEPNHILNDCWGVSSSQWEPHLGRMAQRAIREWLFSSLSPLGPWLWKEDSVGQWSVYSLSGSNTQRGRAAFTAAALQLWHRGALSRGFTSDTVAEDLVLVQHLSAFHTEAERRLNLGEMNFLVNVDVKLIVGWTKTKTSNHNKLFTNTS